MTSLAGRARVVRVAGVVVALWGVSLFIVGPRIWHTLTGGPPTATDQIGVRALGARHVGQGLFQAVAPTTGQRVLVTVDLLHATSMFVLAVADAPRHRPALVSATVAATNAALLLWWSRERGGTR
jgi:hypothetical protein